MNWKTIRNKKWFRWGSNIYVLVSLVFVIWMLFFDTNSWWFTHRELDHEIEKLQLQKKHLQQEIAKDKKALKALRDKKELERFAREEYYYKKDNEEIFIIEYEDSLKTIQND
ncbi:septum formation initiator family protein [Robertkochia marina]|uniref:Septum formation initiator family protein n=1 Tax=Robertkochia marina TaxID=1227945 RepID=A0A4V3UY03_9FLAO|nr:septum formation initiator family protein [Robertkochia marina]THD66594.1 septum formation initiator family protein [Robertkochia marina]TRZ45567.1 septum formation initiator family protein [Robertkochia marina]